MRSALVVAFMLIGCVAAEAHGRITPRDSHLGSTETYTARVPTEAKVATTSVQLNVPDGVTIVFASAPDGATYDLKREGTRVVAITWTVQINPGEARGLSFVARNPDHGHEIVWNVHQRYADGTSSEWVGPAGSRGPAPVTTLAP